MHDDSFSYRSSSDGLVLAAYRWSSPDPNAAVVLSHGLAEHARRYDRFAQALTAAGFSVYALDHRGHGASPGPRGLGDFGAGGWNALVGDLAQLVEHARAAHPNVPVVLFGHSMGSFAAQQYCYERSARIDALVLSGSTAWELDSGGRRAPSLPPNRAFEPARTPYDWLSRDPVEVDAYIADPLCGFEGQPAGPPRIDWKAIYDPQGPSRIRSDLPVLLVAGDQDPINRQLEGLRLLERRWRESGVVRIDTHYYAGGRHEMLNEINREAVTRDSIVWMQDVLGLDAPALS